MENELLELARATKPNTKRAATVQDLIRAALREDMALSTLISCDAQLLQRSTEA